MKRKISKHPTKAGFLSCPSVPESGPVAIVFDAVDDDDDGNLKKWKKLMIRFGDGWNDGKDCRICWVVVDDFEFSEFRDDDDDDGSFRLFDTIFVVDGTAVAVLWTWLPSAWETMMVFAWEDMTNSLLIRCLLTMISQIGEDFHDDDEERDGLLFGGTLRRTSDWNP